ncbi:MAG: hypothetical protein IIT50_02915, partial [Bacteroidales bacterium]|nr:hypothetical protein [Bacteroidales bacterium]
MRWSVGAAYTFLDRGLLSVDYEHVNYASTRLKEENGTPGIFTKVNDDIRQDFLGANIVRAGAEIRLGQSIALRGGYQYYSPAVKGYAARQAYSAGIGFNLGQATTLDFAWTKLAAVSDSFQLYDNYSTAVSVPVGTNTHSLSKVVCTLAVKF